MKNKLFIALDTGSFERASKIVEIIESTKTEKLKIGYKVGLELINAKYGRYFLRKIKNKIIFLDLKLNDIPNTCSSVIKSIKDLKVNYLTIHISSGIAALKAVKKLSGKTKIVGVTTLTSFDQKSLKEIGYNRKLESLVLHQARLASKAKLDALVCSAHEVKKIKKIFKKEIITPGIRFNSISNDQKRVLSPKDAYKNGSDWLVIGRPITKGNIKSNIKKLIDHLNK